MILGEAKPLLGLGVTVLVLLGACSADTISNISEPADWSTKIGWLHGNCLAIQNSNLPTGAELSIVRLDAVQTMQPAQIAAPATSGAECAALLEDRRQVNDSNGFRFYQITTDGPAVDLGIGIPGPNVSANGERALPDLDGDGNPESFSQCSTTEGVSFGVWKDHAYDGVPLWSAYYYLGYDAEANCPVDPAGEAHISIE